MKPLIFIFLCFSILGCSTKEQKLEKDYLKIIHNSERAIEFGQMEVKIGEETIARGKKRIADNEATIATTEVELDKLLSLENEIIIEEKSANE